jgi:transposase
VPTPIPPVPVPADAIYVGIDVSSDRLDLARHDQTQTWSFTNDEKGIADLLKLLKPWKPARIAVESTGKLERPLLTALFDAQLNACHVNPQRVRNFADGMGWLAKTDSLDARVLARFAEKAGPRISTKSPEKQAELTELLTCRRQLIDARTAHRNQRTRTFSDFARKRLDNVLENLKTQIEQLDDRIAQIIDSDDDMSHLNTILQSVTGVGVVLAATLIAQLREIGHLDHRPLSALVGLAPYNNDSGRHKGDRSIRGGRSAVRSVLYVCTVAAIRHNPILSAKYKQLRADGKAAKVAIIACARKLLRILNALVRDNVTWQNPKLQNT